MIKYATPAGVKEVKINIEEFLKLYKEDQAVLVDIRMLFEKKYGVKICNRIIS